MDEKKYNDVAPESDKITGAKKNDLGKQRWDLIPLNAVAKIVEIYTYGANKYGPNNWQKLADFEDRYFAAMMRHLEAHRRGERYDKESGFLHVAHVGWGAVALIWNELQKERTPEKEVHIECVSCGKRDPIAAVGSAKGPLCMECYNRSNPLSESSIGKDLLDRLAYLDPDNQQLYYPVQCDRCGGSGDAAGFDRKDKVCGKCFGNGVVLQNVKLYGMGPVHLSVSATPAPAPTQAPVQSRVTVCPNCKGFGKESHTGTNETTACPYCLGSGRVRLTPEPIDGGAES